MDTDQRTLTEKSSPEGALVLSTSKVVMQLASHVRRDLVLGSLSYVFVPWALFMIAASYLNTLRYLSISFNPISILFDPRMLIALSVVSTSLSYLAYHRGRKKWTDMDRIHAALLTMYDESKGERTTPQGTGYHHGTIDTCISVTERLPQWAEDWCRLRMAKAIAMGVGILLSALVFTWTDPLATVLGLAVGFAALISLGLRARGANISEKHRVAAWSREKQSQEEQVRRLYE